MDPDARAKEFFKSLLSHFRRFLIGVGIGLLIVGLGILFILEVVLWR